MVDISTIIEGVVKYRDGKKVRKFIYVFIEFYFDLRELKCKQTLPIIKD